MQRYEIQTEAENIEIGIKMIRLHAPRGYMPVELACLESTWSVSAEVKGHMPLVDYLQRNVLDDRAFSRLLLSLVEPLIGKEKYYIYTEYIDFRLERIYYSPETKICKYIYGSGNIAHENLGLQNLIREIIYEHARLIHPNSEFVSRVLTYLKEPGWHLKGLVYQLENSDAVEGPLSEGTSLSSMPVHEAREFRAAESECPKSGDFKIKDNKNQEAGERRAVLSMDKLKNSMGRFKISGGSVLVGIGVVVVLVLVRLQISSEVKMGAGIVTGALLYYLHYKRKAYDAFSKKDVGVNPPAASSSRERRYKPSPVKMTFESPDHENKTVFARKSVGGAALIDETGASISLSQKRHVIGRQKEQSDIHLAGNDTVGRTHAELVEIESGYAVKDLKSINGTYVNGKKVFPGEPIALLSGDTLRISDVEFRYMKIDVL